MTNKKPQNVDEYIKWMKEQHEIEISPRTSTYYESVTSKIKQDFQQSEFWLQVIKNIREYDAEYLVSTGYLLLMPNYEPELLIKSYNSFLLKTFRKNIIENKHWPNEPEDGWIFPSNWYCKINDIIRTLFIVKYLDGVDFFINKIQSLCSQNYMDCSVSLEAKEEGYYAAHLYTKKEFEIPRVTWDTE